MYIADYLIVIALDEEYQSAIPTLSNALGIALPLHPEGPLVTSRTRIPFDIDGRRHEELLVAVCPGQMGHAPIAAVLPFVLDRYRPRDIILIGLSGSFDPNDLRLGDVLVPMKVFGYADAKVSQKAGKNVWTFRTLGDRVTSHSRAEIRTIANDSALLRSWEESCRAAAEGDPRIAGRLGRTSHEYPKIHAHHNDSLATGDVVVSSKIFAQELRRHVSPTLRAVDMEAGGLFEALDKVDWEGRVLVLRGISDFADRAKSRLEEDTKGGWRVYAMQNAVRLAAALIRQRPRWDAQRTSASRPYRISLEPHPESYRLCSDMQLNNGEKGAQNLAFTTLLSRDSGTPRLDVRIEAIGEATARPVQMLLREKNDPYVETRHHVRPNRRIEMKKDATDRPFQLELFASAPGPIAVNVTVEDEFGRLARAQFPERG